MSKLEGNASFVKCNTQEFMEYLKPKESLRHSENYENVDIN